MEKTKKNSRSVDVKNVTSSPYFVAALLALIIVAIIALIVYFMSGIKDTKAQINDARTLLAQNKQSVRELDMLRARSEEAQKELSRYEGILPSSLGDAYKLQDKVYEACADADLTVNSFDISQVQGATYETVINLDISGKFTDIH
ncbi:MAG: type 4a pilus biogenesis protein PilO, partial [Clostridia bacterium]|nr:type 4a pilus biogenesis protein PilO [Clostridia bacterium]